MPAVFEGDGIRFLYPDNWKLVGDGGGEDGSVTVQSPQGAFWSVSRHRAGPAAQTVAGEILSAMRREYPQVEVEEAQDQVGGALAVGYDMRFYCLDLLVVSTVRTVEQSGRTLAIMCQAEDRDFDRLKSVFSAITHSLLVGESAAGE